MEGKLYCNEIGKLTEYHIQKTYIMNEENNIILGCHNS